MIPDGLAIILANPTNGRPPGADHGRSGSVKAVSYVEKTTRTAMQIGRRAVVVGDCARIAALLLKLEGRGVWERLGQFVGRDWLVCTGLGLTPALAATCRRLKGCSTVGGGKSLGRLFRRLGSRIGRKYWQRSYGRQYLTVVQLHITPRDLAEYGTSMTSVGMSADALCRDLGDKKAACVSKAKLFNPQGYASWRRLSFRRIRCQQRRRILGRRRDRRALAWLERQVEARRGRDVWLALPRSRMEAIAYPEKALAEMGRISIVLHESRWDQNFIFSGIRA